MKQEVPSRWRSYVRRSIEGFGGHREVVLRFGRFPHRNQVLGRQSTPEERTYLESDPPAYGQSKL